MGHNYLGHNYISHPYICGTKSTAPSSRVRRRDMQHGMQLGMQRGIQCARCTAAMRHGLQQHASRSATQHACMAFSKETAKGAQRCTRPPGCQQYAEPRALVPARVCIVMTYVVMAYIRMAYGVIAGERDKISGLNRQILMLHDEVTTLQRGLRQLERPQDSWANMHASMRAHMGAQTWAGTCRHVCRRVCRRVCRHVCSHVRACVVHRHP